MAELRQIYKCQTCGNVVEVVRAGICDMVCCDKPMLAEKANSVDAALEKHVPVIEKIDNGFLVKVGSEPHPMLPEHHIEWIELIANGQVYRKELKVGEAPEAIFLIRVQGPVEAREYCNLHKLWNSRFEA
jgi:superoxide reductase